MAQTIKDVSLMALGSRQSSLGRREGGRERRGGGDIKEGRIGLHLGLFWKEDATHII